ncbi:MAG: histidinol-phosphate transaminase [Proteobacteria bacterium]|nr:histidinol-phosphate transaminase [Pseudomonadota bacterium]
MSWSSLPDGSLESLPLPHLSRIQPYVPGKPLEELSRERGITHPIKLASNESPMGPSPKVIEAIERAARDCHRYPDGDAFKLRRALAGHHDVEPGEISFGNGSNELVDLLCRTFVSTYHHAVIPKPSFVAYDLSLRIGNVPTTAVALRDNHYWNLEAMRAAIRPKTRLCFIANPNNPTGTYVGHEELERFVCELPDHVIPVIDEAYVEFADAPDYKSALDMRGICPRLVVLRTFSKAYGLAGLRIGYAIVPRPFNEQINRVRMPFNVSSMAQAAALAALGDPEHVQQYVELNNHERGRLGAGLEELGLRVIPSQANFLCVELGRPAKPIYERLLDLGVIVRPLGAILPEALRISVGLPEENEQLLRTMSEALGDA